MRVIRACLLVMVLSGLAGCMSWNPGWELPVAPPSGGDAAGLLSSATRQFDSAHDAAGVRAAVDTMNRALDSDPSSRAILERLAEAQILYGAAYASGKAEKGEWYRAGIQSAERAMATNREFRRRVESGQSIGEAAEALGPDEMRPMLFWVTGVSYYFKECLGGAGRAVYFRWMLRTREVMERMYEIDPEFENGTVLFSLAIYHIAAPPGAGRDMALSADYLERAIAAGPESLLPRWGRAKYYYSRTGDDAAFRSDLEWVLSRDPHTASSSYAWNVYFQSDAREMLATANPPR